MQPRTLEDFKKQATIKLKNFQTQDVSTLSNETLMQHMYLSQCLLALKRCEKISLLSTEEVKQTLYYLQCIQAEISPQKTQVASPNSLSTAGSRNILPELKHSKESTINFLGKKFTSSEKGNNLLQRGVTQPPKNGFKT